MVSAVDLAKRAFIKVLLQLAATYAVKLSLSRDSPADAVSAAYRKVSLKVHPDKGGTDEQQTALNAAREAWETAKVAAPGKGKKRKAAEAETPESSLQLVPVLPVRVMKYMAAQYRIQSLAVLLTFQKFTDKAVWPRFTKFVRDNLQEWSVKMWCATMETNEDGTYHFHLCLQFQIPRHQKESHAGERNRGFSTSGQRMCPCCCQLRRGGQ